MDAVEIMLASVVALIVALPIFFITDYCTGTKETTTAVVLDKSWSPGTSGSGVAVVPQSNGSLGVGVVSTSTSPSYELIVEFADGHRDTISTDKDTMLYTEVGATIEPYQGVGGITGWHYGWSYYDEHE